MINYCNKCFIKFEIKTTYHIDNVYDVLFRCNECGNYLTPYPTEPTMEYNEWIEYYVSLC